MASNKRPALEELSSNISRPSKRVHSHPKTAILGGARRGRPSKNPLQQPRSPPPQPSPVNRGRPRRRSQIRVTPSGIAPVLPGFLPTPPPPQSPPPQSPPPQSPPPQSPPPQSPPSQSTPPPPPPPPESPPVRRNPGRNRQLPSRFRENDSEPVNRGGRPRARDRANFTPPGITPAPPGFIRNPNRLGENYLLARWHEPAVEKYHFHTLSPEPNTDNCPSCQAPHLINNQCPHCGALSWPEERGTTGRWHCCDNGRIQVDFPDSPLEIDTLETPEDNITQSFERQVRLIQDYLTNRQSPIGREFVENIVTYNNALSFTTEQCASKEGTWSTFKIQGALYHSVPPLMPEIGHRPRFLQIYNMDSTQDEVDTRLGYTPALNPSTLRLLQRMLRHVNPYVESFKSCSERVDRDTVSRMRLRQVDPTYHQRGTHNLPVSKEVATLIIGDDEQQGGDIERDLILETHAGGLQRLPYYHPSYMPLRYPLLLPFGEPGWHDRITANGRPLLPNDHLLARRNVAIPAGHLQNHDRSLPNNNDDGEQIEEDDHLINGRGGSVRLTQLNLYKSWLFSRPQRFNRILHSGRLLQHFVVDVFACIELNNLNYLRRNQQSLRADCYRGLADALQNGVTDLNDIGTKATILPSSYIGSPRHMKGLMQDAMALCRRFGKPDFFITFTCNPKWPEITQELQYGESATDRPDLVVRVFRIYLKELLNDLLRRRVLGHVIAYTYTIEFQKRGLPHAHILLILYENDRITTDDALDQTIRADIPQTEPLRSRVLSHMIHRCSNRCKDEITGKCSKNFPKPLQPVTIWRADSGYPLYRRPDGIQDESGLTNAAVVPYNPYLSLKFDAHVNVELCSSVKSIQYIYKYITKGSDRADIVVERPTDTTRPPVIPQGDEIAEYHSARWLGTSEALYRLMEFPMHESKPPVYRLQIHNECEQRILFNPERDDPARLQDQELLRKTMLTEYFHLNQVACQAVATDQAIPYVKNPLDCLYDQLPEFFVWKKKAKTWADRKKGDTIGRIYFMGPKAGDLFYLRQLLLHVKGATSFEHLRTVNSIVYPTYKEACFYLGLIADDNECDEAMAEASVFGTGQMVRYLFVALLIECEPTNPLRLWENYKDSLSSDCRYFLTRDFPRLPVPLDTSGEIDSDAQRQQEYEYALFILNTLLEQQATPHRPHSLLLHNLPAPTIDFDEFAEERNRYIREELRYTHTEESASEGLEQLNACQRSSADVIIRAVDSSNHKLFFLNGPGGTGKTRVQNIILAHFRARQRVVLAVASSGIASTLLEGGRTAHSRFKIPLDADAASHCEIKKGTEMAALLIRAELIFWDEAPMQSRYDMQAVDRCLQDLTGNPSAFGGKVICFCGDFRQTLPVVDGASCGQIIQTSMIHAPFWPSVQRLDLTENMRLRDPSLDDLGRQQVAEFAHHLLQIGDGATNVTCLGGRTVAPWAYGRLSVNTESALIDAIYPRLAAQPPTIDYFSERAILAVTNRQVHHLNTVIATRLPGQEYLLRSADEAVNPEDRETFAPEYFNTLSETSLPDHLLTLKVGMPVMLLRNLQPPRLCNGTRLMITAIGTKIIKGSIMGGSFANEEVLIPRIPLQTKENNKRIPCQFKRLQFPLKAAFAMTINKSQGQSMRHVGVDLQSKEVFSHGQLYVALSRVTSSNNLRLIGPGKEEYVSRKMVQNVVWKQVLLPAATV